MATDALVLDREARMRAIEPTGSFIVQAPAGSGKTTLLTLRFLRLLAEVERPEQIVAITFTRKAASEMRHRIVAALRKAREPLEEGVDERTEELHRHAAAALARSRELGWGLEQNPARLHVQTIDGLNHWLARRLPLAARIGTSAVLVDDARALYAEAARRTVAMLDEDAPVAAGLLRLARSLNHEPRQLAALIEGMLGVRELWLPKLMRGASGSTLRAEIDWLLGQALETELKSVSGSISEIDWRPLFAACRAAAAAGAPETPATALAELSGLPPAKVESTAAWCALADLLLTAGKKPSIRRKVDAPQGFLAASAGPAWPPLKRAMKAVLDSLAAHDGLVAALTRLRLLPPPALTDSQWERIDALSSVLPHAVAELLALFAERDSLDHPAVAAAARDALGFDAGPTELALALDYRIRHLLVDEYQDTSVPGAPARVARRRLGARRWQKPVLRGRSDAVHLCVPRGGRYAFPAGTAPGHRWRRARRRATRADFRSSSAIVDWVNETFSTLLPDADDFERGAVRYSPAAAAKAGEAGDGVRVHPFLDADARAMAAEVAEVAQEAIATLGHP